MKQPTRKSNAFPKGTPVAIKNHWGARGSSGKISRKAPERINGHTYWTVRLTAGKAADLTMMFLASQLERI